MSIRKTETPEQKAQRLEWHRRYYRINRERMLAGCRENYLKNRESKILAAKNYRIKNLEKVRLTKRKYWALHAKEINLKSSIWQKEHKEHRKEYLRKYKRDHSAKIRAQNQNRRALVRAATENLRLIESWMQSVLENVHTVCYWCNKRIDRTMIHFDHIVPISKGGAHSIENLCVSCSYCNLSKHNKSVGAWIRIGQQILDL